MELTGQKLKKLKINRVYGFKKEHASLVGENADPTLTTSLLCAVVSKKNNGSN